MSVGDLLKKSLASYVVKKVLAYIAGRYAFLLAPPWGAIVSWLLPKVIEWLVINFSSDKSKKFSVKGVKRLEFAISNEQRRSFHVNYPKL